MNIIANLSFWIMKPKKKSLIAWLSFEKMQPLAFEDIIMDALPSSEKKAMLRNLRPGLLGHPCLLKNIIYLNSCAIR